jgi:putative ABC transport system permease protein
VVNVLNIKVGRDLWQLRAQVISIAVMLGAGIAVFVMSASNYFALVTAMDAHYRNERLADLFASVKRAPLPLVNRIREIDGIGVVQPRVVQFVRILREDSDIPISGRIIGIPGDSQPLLNRLYLVEGRWIDPAHANEVIVNAAYAEARSVRPGDAIDVVLNGRLQQFRVVGVALSPEFVFATQSAIPLPDDRNFVVLWAGEAAVESAFDMAGAFNDVLMTVAPGSSKSSIVEDVDRLLLPFGGRGAHDRLDLPSHRFVEDELAEQKTLSIVMPAIFFGISAFLLHVVLGRLVEAQREQIASLKALGYPNFPITLHYFKLVTVIALLGAIIGVLLGRYFATTVIDTYKAFFRFPVLEPQLQTWIIVLALAVSLIAANLAAASSVYRITRLTPADALRPAAPSLSRLTLGFSSFGSAALPLQYLIAARTILARPFRTLFTTLGIALAVPLVLFGLFWFDAIDYMIDVTFERIERGDALLSFSAPVAAGVQNELRAVPGVLQVEIQRIVPVKLHGGHQTYRTAVVGLEAGSELKVLRDPDLRPLEAPLDGVMLSRPLADRLSLSLGDSVVVEVLEGKRPIRELTIRKISDDILGFSATMELSALSRLLREDRAVNAAALKIDPALAHKFWHEIQSMPKVEGSSVKAQWLTMFEESIAGMIIVGAVILAGFGILIAVGVVYNSARVALQERAWELASLRILGFTRREVATVLFAELALELTIAIPLGLVIGTGLIQLIASLRASESFQIPAIIEPSSYAIAAFLVLAAATASAAVIWDRIAKLDLVAVLKTRD